MTVNCGINLNCEKVTTFKLILVEDQMTDCPNDLTIGSY